MTEGRTVSAREIKRLKKWDPILEMGLRQLWPDIDLTAHHYDTPDGRCIILNPTPEEAAWFKDRDKHRAKMRREQESAERRRRRVINHRMQVVIGRSLKGEKCGRSWQALVGYTLDDLRAHLEAKFTDGMSWENAGAWHIDHARPLSSFSITGPDCPEFRKAWALENLQPLWAADNLRKGSRWDG